MNICKVTISAIFDNHIRNYIVISTDTYEQAFGKWHENTVMVSTKGDEEAIAEKINEIDEVTGVTQLSITKNSVGSALSSIDYIILMVILFSATLAFIVIFNLTNINISERSRQIATVQVLGFYTKETESYVLRENVVLSVIAGFIGLPLGVGFHKLVMSMVKIDLVDFNEIIKPVSFIYALIGTVLFAFIVNVFMKRQIGKIKMAESLKAVE
jgi:putative ABC transport system permease protein